MVPLVRSPAHCWAQLCPQSHNSSFSSSVSTSAARGPSERGTKGTETAALREGGSRDKRRPGRRKAETGPRKDRSGVGEKETEIGKKIKIKNQGKVDTVGEGEGGTNWEISFDINTLPCVK